MIPRRSFWLFDVIALGIAFFGTYWVFPMIRSMLPVEVGGVIRLPGPTRLAIPYPPFEQMPPLTSFLWVYLILTPVALVILALMGGHAPLLGQSRSRILATSLVAPIGGLGLISTVLFGFSISQSSRLFIFLFTALSILALASYRLILWRYLAHRKATGRYRRNVVAIGHPSAIEWLAAHFVADIPEMDYSLIGHLTVASVEDDPSLQSALSGLGDGRQFVPDCVGPVSQLGECLVNQPIHEVIVIYPVSGGEWLDQVIKDCDYFGVTLRIIPEVLIGSTTPELRTLYRSEPLGLPSIVLAPPNWDSDALFFKRLIDIAVSGTLLLMLLPLFAVVALAIKITTPKLSIFYPWRVVGENGVEFTGYKFTTMVEDADARKSELMAQNEMDGPVFKIKEDPRITPLGRLLRKYSINELPQLWSVLKGDMSLVGPRPAFRHELERYKFWHKRKLCIKPGITCLWQVRGRNRISSFDDWVRMDLEYIDNWSIWLDFKILLWTALVVVRGTGW